MKMPDDRKRHAMDAITNAQTVAHLGLLKATGGVALYAAHIRQVCERRPKTAAGSRM